MYVCAVEGSHSVCTYESRCVSDANAVFAQSKFHTFPIDSILVSSLEAPILNWMRCARVNKHKL